MLTNFILTLTDDYSIVNTQFSELSIYSHMNAQTMTVYKMSNATDRIQPHIVIWIVIMRTDIINEPNTVNQAEKHHCQISQTL